METLHIWRICRPGRVLGEVRGTDYFKGQNHRDLQVVWSPDSSVCVLKYERRYGFDSVFALELKGEGFRQIDLGEHIQKVSDDCSMDM